MCGACKEGALIPLFTTRTPSKKTTKLSRMAAIKSQGNQSPKYFERFNDRMSPPDSPISAQNTGSNDHVPNPSASDDSEIEILADIFAMTGIGNNEKAN